MRNMKKMIALLMALTMVLALAACGSSGSSSASSGDTASTQDTASTESSSSDSTSDTAESSDSSETVTAEVTQSEAASPDEGGFQEFPIWEDEEIGFLNVNGVYFQPVPMSGGNENFEDFDLHFEADVSALPNDLGYGVGDWVPYMTVDYELTGDNGDVITGTFMPMNADDGNHYGANIKMPNAGTYSVKLTFHSPEENGFLIHLDDETGPGGAFDEFEWPLVLELDDVWDYIPQEW